MRKMSTGDARDKFAEIVNEAAYADKRTVITRHGKEVAAIVPISDLNSASAPKPALPEGAMVICQTPQIITMSVPSEVEISLTKNGD